MLGVSTRKADDLVQALGMTGVSKGEVAPHLWGAGHSGGGVSAAPARDDVSAVWLDAKFVKVCGALSVTPTRGFAKRLRP